jgi:hypothetical protein
MDHMPTHRQILEAKYKVAFTTALNNPKLEPKNAFLDCTTNPKYRRSPYVDMGRLGLFLHVLAQLNIRLDYVTIPNKFRMPKNNPNLKEIKMKL